MGGYSYGIHAFLNIFQLKSSKGNVQKVEFVVFDIKWKLFIQRRSGSLFGKSMRRGSIYRQSGFRHGCDARWNSLTYKWNLLTKFPQSLEPVTELAPSQGQFECSLIFFDIQIYNVSRHILIGEGWPSSSLLYGCFYIWSYYVCTLNEDGLI